LILFTVSFSASAFAQTSPPKIAKPQMRQSRRPQWAASLLERLGGPRFGPETARIPRDLEVPHLRPKSSRRRYLSNRQARFHPIKNNNSPWMRSWAEGEEMTGKISAEVPNMRQRTILQHLSLADWRMVDRLPVKAGELTLSRLLQLGWIECRGEKQHAAIRLTPAGLKAMRSPI
jgi:hypothetical protein